MAKSFDDVFREKPDVYGTRPNPWIVKIKDLVAPPANILDLGVAYGRNALFLAKLGFKVHGVDISKVGIDLCMKEAQKSKLTITCEVADLNSYIIKDDFDVIFSTATLHFLSDDGRKHIFSQMKAKTKSGGYNIISGPTKDKIAIQFSHFLDLSELKKEYADWELVESGNVESMFSNGKMGSSAYIIVRKK